MDFGESTAPSFRCYRVGLLYITGHEGGYNVVYYDGRYTTIPAASPSEANAASDLAAHMAPPDPVPARVSRRGLFLALLETSSSLTRAALRGGLAGNEAALIEFDEAQYFERTHPLVSAIAANLDLTAAEVDAIFVRATEL